MFHPNCQWRLIIAYRNQYIGNPSESVPSQSTMNPPNKTYLEALEERARLHPDQPVFWIPQVVEPGKPVSEWRPMTFSQFYAAVSIAKQFYEAQGTKLNIPKGSVIGIWYSFVYLTLLKYTLISYLGCLETYIPILFKHMAYPQRDSPCSSSVCTILTHRWSLSCSSNRMPKP